MKWYEFLKTFSLVGLFLGYAFTPDWPSGLRILSAIMAAMSLVGLGVLIGKLQ